MFSPSVMLSKKNFHRRWVETFESSEHPKSFLLATSFSMFGAMLGRRCWFNYDDVIKIFPLLSPLLISPSGVGKSTSLHLGFSLLEAIPESDRPTIIAGGLTPEKLHHDLSFKPWAILYASELATMFSKAKYAENLIPYITDLLDLRSVERRTKTDNLIVVKDPAVSVVGGSTVEWLQSALPDTAISGGFLARFLILYEEYKAQKVALPSRTMGNAQRVSLVKNREALTKEFRTLTSSLSGEFIFDNFTASDVYESWYTNYKPASGHLRPFAARAGEHILRISMLVAAGEGRTRIEDTDVKSAIRFYEYTAQKLQQVVVPFTPTGRLLSLVLQTVADAPKSDVEIYRAMSNFISATDVDKLLSSLIRSKEIDRLGDGRFVKRV